MWQGRGGSQVLINHIQSGIVPEQEKGAISPSATFETKCDACNGV